MRHIVESQQFDHLFLADLFADADKIEAGHDAPLRGKILASLFYEPSTRTRFSFESAMLRLGGRVLSTENASEFSSAAKGETLEDTVRVASNYADVIVLRHFDADAAQRAAAYAHVPIINAGSGPGQHPTQALLDLYTIRRELGRTDDLTIAMVGDLAHGRTVRSLSYLLGKFNNIRIVFVSPTALKIGSDIKDYLDRHGVAYAETERLDQALGVADVLYQTRIQKERFPTVEEYEKFKGVYRIDPIMVRLMRPGSILMHPLPRVDEISPEVDNFPQAVYFKQAKYGVLVRMALLKWVLE